ncbi:hypothetical protein [Tenacibaculum maritimum]|uniref:Uncharacterized protein n=1 Tax=Tenacibaculum maritimum NCIMB 2154 TaxID=1349785 RepID=A0A2H1EB16_9FLAO|nr:hypothetical protein [Tenacibaculum maritimum]MCD9564288.1 hypothetical protein [Tenacibaculum maritimum]MCD9567108.1 hypothetical protein [Tenacibaculum maritimum]MCD9580327.1 hypothetical protein [Tenacibaculum maritimum]MCD9585935.1 hypothetical protein [Tenacibaculum maritimum]MCD9598091.1 hypothetical protein [Tenacibaculum maritimum]
MFSFFKNYKYSTDFFLPIPWVEKLRPEIDQKKINRKVVSKKINKILDTTFNKKRTSKIGVNYVSKYYVAISVYTKDIDLLENLKKELKDNTNLYPFWVAFPNSFHGSPCWRQGIQEIYATESWLPSWVSLNENEKHKLFKKYNASKDWQEWLLENNKDLTKYYLNKVEL